MRSPATPWYGRRPPGAGRLLAVVSSLAMLALPALVMPAAAATAARSLRVVLDAGHGGRDPGTISPFFPLQEKDVTLRLALLTSAALQRRGVAVVLTRTDDRYVPLEERAAAARRNGAGLLLSLHLNAAPNPLAGGAEAWYGEAPGADALAGTLLAALDPALRGAGLSVRGTRAGPELAVLRTAVPAALLELGYVSNARDAAVLARQPFLAAAAEAIAAGVVAFRDAPGATDSSGSLPAVKAVLAAPPPAARRYTIQPGDTLSEIALRYGSTVDTLARANAIPNPDQILAGVSLTLPAT